MTLPTLDFGLTQPNYEAFLALGNNANSQQNGITRSL